MSKLPNSETMLMISRDQDKSLDLKNRPEILKAVYKQLFKENRDLEFFHNAVLDSSFLEGKLTTRQFVCKLISSEMYRDYILLVNSNYHFVKLCFERVLGRPATNTEIMTWSSLLATQGLESFARALTSSEEYLVVFGDDQVPARRSDQISSSNQGLPALPESQSRKRYDGPGREAQLYGGSGGSLYPWEGSMPPKLLRKIGAVLVVAGVIEVTRIVLILIFSALNIGPS